MEFEFKPTQTDAESLKQYSELLSEVFPNAKKYTIDFLNWQYNLNPCGKVVGFDAFYKEELAAHYVSIPVLYKKNDKRYKGLLSLNTATKQNYQGKSLFTQLAERTYESAKKQGYQFVIGVANQNSTHGFVKKLGFDLIAPLDAYIYLGDNKQQTIPEHFFQSDMDNEMINWRISNPSNNYLFSNRFVFSKTDYKLINACLSKSSRFGVIKNQNKPVLGFKMVIGINNVPKTVLKYKIPEKHKPSPLNLIFKKLNNEIDFSVDASTIFFELMDFDAY